MQGYGPIFDSSEFALRRDLHLRMCRFLLPQGIKSVIIKMSALTD